MLNRQLNKHICMLLDIPEAILNEYFTDEVDFASVLWHYLPLTPEMRAGAKNGFVQGMHGHRDTATLYNCLIQSRPGLQVQNHAGEWIDVPMVRGGVVCNIGTYRKDRLSFWVTHRVRNGRGAAHETDRRQICGHDAPCQHCENRRGSVSAYSRLFTSCSPRTPRYTIPYAFTTRLEKPVLPLPKYAHSDIAKDHASPNLKILKLMSISDPLVRSGYVKLTLFPAATKKLYPKEFAEAQRMGIL